MVSFQLSTRNGPKQSQCVCVCAAHVGIIILSEYFKEGMLGLECSRTIDKVYNSDK